VRRFINDHIEDSIAEKIINNQKKKSFEIKVEKNEIVVS
jgi:ATP-dependent Clp protease ATP-binding subunit ClpA